MKINMSLERYDIDALDEIYTTAADLHQKSELLETLGTSMRAKLNASADEFSTTNYTRVQEATEDYLHKMKLMKEGLTELSESCRELAEKIAAIWS